MHPNELLNGDRKRFLLAGNATVTFESQRTGKHFTYNIKKHREKDLWFVSYLGGQDNENDYFYLGCIFDNHEFRLTAKSRATSEALVYKAFDFVWRHIDHLTTDFKIYHEGSCGRCGRTLTDPESIRGELAQSAIATLELKGESSEAINRDRRHRLEQDGRPC